MFLGHGAISFRVDHSRPKAELLFYFKLNRVFCCREALYDSTDPALCEQNAILGGLAEVSC